MDIVDMFDDLQRCLLVVLCHIDDILKNYLNVTAQKYMQATCRRLTYRRAPVPGSLNASQIPIRGHLFTVLPIVRRSWMKTSVAKWRNQKVRLHVMVS